MKLYCAGASSKGNSFALQSSTGQTLFLEAGCHYKEIEKQLSYKVDYSKAWLLVSHKHGDHCKYVDEYVKRGIRGYSNADTAFPFNPVGQVKPLEWFTPGEEWTFKSSFVVMPFTVQHDVPDYGYLIRHPEMGSLVFFTDAYNVPYEFLGVNHWLVEANYDDVLLNDNWISGRIDKRQRDRLMLSHMSFPDCLQYLKACHAENSSTIILTHLSSRNAWPDVFKARCEAAFGVPTYIARKGLIVELNKNGL